MKNKCNLPITGDDTKKHEEGEIWYECTGEEHEKLTVDSGRITVIGSTPCPTYQEKERVRLENKIESERIYETFVREKEPQTFDNLDMKVNGIKTHIPKLTKFLEDGSQRTLIIAGSVGLGKTHIANAMLNKIRNVRNKLLKISDKVIKIANISSHQLYETFILHELDRSNPEYADRIKDLWNIEIVFIDDLGEEKQTEKQIFNDNFKEFLDLRIGKLMITTNLNQGDLKKRYGGKIFSRLMEGAVVVYLEGEDYRLMGGKE